MAFRDLAEHEKARQWREALGLTRDQLSDLTGYSRAQIQLLEGGKTNQGEDISDVVWLRYRLICAAVMAGLEFDWRKVKFGDQVITADEWRGED